MKIRVKRARRDSSSSRSRWNPWCQLRTTYYWKHGLVMPVAKYRFPIQNRSEYILERFTVRRENRAEYGIRGKRLLRSHRVKAGSPLYLWNPRVLSVGSWSLTLQLYAVTKRYTCVPSCASRIPQDVELDIQSRRVNSRVNNSQGPIAARIICDKKN